MGKKLFKFYIIFSWIFELEASLVTIHSYIITAGTGMGAAAVFERDDS